jgi:hypothetical protein
MTYRELIPVGPLGRRLRKAFVAGALYATTYTAWRLLRNPAWDGWWDAFNWPQLFLYAPILFFFGVALWQLVCFVAEYLYQQRKAKAGNLSSEPWLEEQRTLRFWLRDSLHICSLYVTTCVIGDIPMAVNYFAVVRGWPLHWWWSSAVSVCLLVTVAAWWTLDRVYIGPSD